MKFLSHYKFQIISVLNFYHIFYTFNNYFLLLTKTSYLILKNTINVDYIYIYIYI